MQRFFCFCALVLLAACAGTALADRYVAQAGQTPGGGYTSWVNAASNIQDAVTAAAVDDTIWISNGIYTATSGAQVVSITKGLTLHGVSGDPNDVIIDGGGIPATRRGIVISLSGTVNLLIDSLTISNCFSTGHASGLYMATGSATSGTARINNCIVTHNFASNNAGNSNRGGGVYANGTTDSGYETVFSGCRFTRNYTWTGSGAGLSLWGGSILMEDCLIEANACRSSSDSSGGLVTTPCRDFVCRNTIIRCNTNNGAWAGGMEIRSGNVFENCVIQSNKAGQAGGVFNRNTGSPPAIFRNCLISHNIVTGSGGGFWAWGSTNVLENCTIVDNSAQGLYVDDNNSSVPAQLRMANCVVYDAIGMINSTIHATNCTAQSVAALTGPNNNTDDPGFVDYAVGNYRLAKGSACINTGTNLPWMAGAHDLDGVPRIDTTGPGIVDRGCYEYPYRGTMIIVQ